MLFRKGKRLIMRLRRFFVNLRRLKRTNAFWVCLSFAVLLPMAGMSWGGTIKGMVRYTGSQVAKKKLKVTIDNYICGKYKDDESLLLSPTHGIRNAVVSLERPPVTKEATSRPPMVKEMDQKQCTYVPHILLVPVGGTVKFLNSDRLLHNIKSNSGHPQFNRAQPKGRAISIKFTTPGFVRVDCDLHSWMHAWVVVADHPFYAITDDEGKFLVGNVPPGKYTLRVWQEILGVVDKEVVVTEMGTTTVTLEMGH